MIKNEIERIVNEFLRLPEGAGIAFKEVPVDMVGNVLIATKLERITDALEAISSTLDSIDQSLDLVSDVLGDCRVKNRNGSAIVITGVIDHV